MIRKKVMQDLNLQEGLRGKHKIVVFKMGCRKTSKQYNALGTPVPPQTPLMSKQHIGEAPDKFKARRKACNTRRREREKKIKLSLMPVDVCIGSLEDIIEMTMGR